MITIIIIIIKIITLIKDHKKLFQTPNVAKHNRDKPTFEQEIVTVENTRLWSTLETSAWVTLFRFMAKAKSGLWLSPLQRLPLGIQIKIAIIEKWKVRGGGWEVSLFPLPIVPHLLSFFPSPQPPYDTKRPLRRRKAPDFEVKLETWSFLLWIALWKWATKIDPIRPYAT